MANHGNGSGLLKDLNHLVKLLKTIRENTNKKITSVKVRLGFDQKIPKEIAHALNDSAGGLCGGAWEDTKRQIPKRQNRL